MSVDSSQITFWIGVCGFAVLLLDRVVSIVRGVTSGEHTIQTQLAVLQTKVEETKGLITTLASKQENHSSSHTEQLANLERRLTILETKGTKHP
jgi:hypothetical protein